MFNTVQEAFNHYRNASLDDIETRLGKSEEQSKTTQRQMSQS